MKNITFCLRKVCKYCFKEYDERHLEINNANHCKVYYRRGEEEQYKNNTCKILLLQFLYVIATYIILFLGIFHLFKKFFFRILNVKINKKSVKCFISFFLIIICFIITIPFVILLYPYFPSILTASDY